MSIYKYPAKATSDKIVAISYPPGGFGHFVYHLFTHYTEETVKIPNHLRFSPTGDAHRQLKYFTTYSYDWLPNFQFEFKTCLKTLPTDKTQILVCDNGGNADTYKLEQYFPNARILRVSVEPEVRYTLLKLHAQKATLLSIPDYIKQYFLPSSSLDKTVEFSDWLLHTSSWHICEDWYSKWYPVYRSNFINLSLKNFLVDPIREFVRICNYMNLTVIKHQELTELIDQWKILHQEYVELLHTWQMIERALDNNSKLDLTNVNDWYLKAGIFYNVCKKYHLKVPGLPNNHESVSTDLQLRIMKGFADTDDIFNFIDTYDIV